MHCNFFVLLTVLLLGPAARMSYSMFSTVSLASIELCHPDPDGLMAGLCTLCSMSLRHCGHDQSQPTPTITLDALFNDPYLLRSHPEWPSEPYVADETPSSSPSPSAYAEPTPLFHSYVRQLDDNATSILPSTMQIHVDNTYLPGDRLAAQSKRQRIPPTRPRQPPRTGAYVCTFSGCGEMFGRACELKRHQKKHAPSEQRPYECAVCTQRFWYPKDVTRHQRTHEVDTLARMRCTHPGCSDVKGFSRMDNLRRHWRNRHAGAVVV
ncbi:hypothetical protein M011DRAFT_337680 [Sporormia fimetaria CBS 119925]|uniref:C2H2-type domain-containing protein n=1 Tax=Sporormia fimetaria CBS 119925 TaxID=1340428 RepID=A0A6A6VG74_9PLEO|nr:hypothetical protein M011DRAFT_337680 [Sporormia fimetaria CBS 119925]